MVKLRTKFFRACLFFFCCPCACYAHIVDDNYYDEASNDWRDDFNEAQRAVCFPVIRL